MSLVILQNNNEEKDIFHEYFPAGEIEVARIEDLPSDVWYFFEKKSEAHLTKSEYQPKSFSRLFRVRHKNGDVTYLAVQTKIYNTKQDAEELIYFADTRRDKMIGYSELHFNISSKSPYFKNKPLVSFTQTYNNYVKQGLGTRRLFLMNAMTQMLYKLSLYSDTLNSPDMKKIWESLVKQGKASKFKENEYDRYAIISR